MEGFVRWVEVSYRFISEVETVLEAAPLDDESWQEVVSGGWHHFYLCSLVRGDGGVIKYRYILYAAHKYELQDITNITYDVNVQQDTTKACTM